MSPFWWIKWQEWSLSSWLFFSRPKHHHSLKEVGRKRVVLSVESLDSVKKFCQDKKKKPPCWVPAHRRGRKSSVWWKPGMQHCSHSRRGAAQWAEADWNGRSQLKIEICYDGPQTAKGWHQNKKPHIPDLKWSLRPKWKSSLWAIRRGY